MSDDVSKAMVLQNKLSMVANIVGHNYEGDNYWGSMVNAKEFNTWYHKYDDYSKYTKSSTPII